MDAMNIQAAADYLAYVVERHKVWERRQAGQPQHWTEDPILRTKKFTNDFRVIDHGSQFLLTELLNEPGLTAADVLARAWLYRMTNRPAVWEYTKATRGAYPRAVNMNDDLRYLWTAWRDAGGQVFSGAYIIMPQPRVTGVDKTEGVLRMAHNMFHPRSPANIVQQFLDAPTMASRFDVLLAQPGIGPFIAMQVLTDFGYSPFGASQNENEFVIAGPGARRGAKAVFPGAKPLDVFKWAQDTLWQLEDTPTLTLPNGQGERKLSLMDIQNTFCEFSKYVRYQQNPGSDRVFPPAHPGPLPEPVLPRHWAN